MKVHKTARCKKNLLQREQLEKIPLLLYRQPMWANKALFSMTEGFLSNFRFNLETSLLNSPNCHEWWRKDWRLLQSQISWVFVRRGRKKTAPYQWVLTPTRISKTHLISGFHSSLQWRWYRSSHLHRASSWWTYVPWSPVNICMVSPVVERHLKRAI